MRIAVIGLGRMGRFYAEALASLPPPVQLAAVADPLDAARTAVQARLGDIPSFAQPEDVLELPDIDAVVVATTTRTHAQVVVAAARAGKAIFCEKPLALTVRQTLETIDAVAQAGAFLQIGFMRRFDPAYQRAKEAIDAGRVGRQLIFKSVSRDPMCPPPGYAAPSQSGGIIIDMGIHDFDMARWLMSSQVDRVSADGTVLVCDEVHQQGDLDNAIVNLHFTSGALGNIEVSRTGVYGYDIRTEVLCSEGAVRVGPTSADDIQVLTRAPERADDTPPFIRRFGQAYRTQIERFVESLQRGSPPLVGGADALAAIQVAEAATESAHTGRPVAVGHEVTRV